VRASRDILYELLRGRRVDVPSKVVWMYCRAVQLQNKEVAGRNRVRQAHVHWRGEVSVSSRQEQHVTLIHLIARMIRFGSDSVETLRMQRALVIQIFDLDDITNSSRIRLDPASRLITDLNLRELP